MEIGPLDIVYMDDSLKSAFTMSINNTLSSSRLSKDTCPQDDGGVPLIMPEKQDGSPPAPIVNYFRVSATPNAQVGLDPQSASLERLVQFESLQKFAHLPFLDANRPPIAVLSRGLRG